ncbi:hypothetical protein EJB05_20694, partial [Eragrostis curvula]
MALVPLIFRKPGAETRGARTTIKDGGGLTALERRMELGAITHEELFILFVSIALRKEKNNWSFV